MLDNEPNTHETDKNDANGHARSGPEPASAPVALLAPAEAGGASGAAGPTGPAVPAALFQAPQVLFQPPAQAATPADGRETASRDSGAGATGPEQGDGEADSGRTGRGSRGARGSRGSRGSRTGRDSAADDDLFSTQAADGAETAEPAADAEADADEAEQAAGGRNRSRRRRSGRGRGTAAAAGQDEHDAGADGEGDAAEQPDDTAGSDDADD